MKPRTKIRSLLRIRRQGTATVEFALVAPIIFMLFFGAIEITRLNFIRQTTSNAAYEASRKAIVPGGTISEASAAATRLLNAVGCGAGATVNVTITSKSVTSTVRVPVNQNAWGLGRFSYGMNIEQSCTLSREQQQ